jgi:hypothetical protein
MVSITLALPKSLLTALITPALPRSLPMALIT